VTTREQGPRNSRKARNWWIIAAFALVPVALAGGLWGILTQPRAEVRVFGTGADVLLVVAILCAMRGFRKLAAGAARSGGEQKYPPAAAAYFSFEDIFISAESASRRCRTLEARLGRRREQPGDRA
jgi:hypothetical protein